MFGINDIYILMPYLMAALCVVFSAWYGIRNWNKEDKDEKGGRL